jgi:hypothetical protein
VEREITDYHSVRCARVCWLGSTLIPIWTLRRQH